MFGGTPVKEKSLAGYAKELDVARLKTQADVLDLAAGLEKGAANAYLGIIPAFPDRQLAKLAGQLANDERRRVSREPRCPLEDHEGPLQSLRDDH